MPGGHWGFHSAYSQRTRQFKPRAFQLIALKYEHSNRLKQPCQMAASTVWLVGTGRDWIRLDVYSVMENESVYNHDINRP